MENKKIKYRGKTIEITKVNGMTILSTDKIFRKQMGVDKSTEEQLLAETKEIIDFERDKR